LFYPELPPCRIHNQPTRSVYCCINSTGSQISLVMRSSRCSTAHFVQLYKKEI